MKKEEQALALCKKYKQEKIARELQRNKNPELIEQVLTIDFEQIEYYKQKIEKEEVSEQEKIEKISYVDGNKLTKAEREHYEKIGKEIIAKGKYSVVTMAGGQRNKACSCRTKRNLSHKRKTKTKIFI